MAFQKVEYTFPDEQEEEVNTDIEIEDSDAIEVDISGKPPEPEVEAKEEVEEDLDIEVVDDTPKADRNRKPSEPPTDVTDEELEQYSEKVRKRIQHFNKGYHDERRAKESAQREREELERYAQTLVDENKELVQEFFNAKRSLWNRTHDIDIHGFEVEVYVQDEGEPHVSTGVYSVLNDTWITKPEPSDPKIDFEGVKSKASMIMDEIDRVWDLFEDKKYEESLNYIEKLKEKIKNMRKTGLEREGQYSNENLAFKILRRNGSMGELLDLRTTVYDKMMSIDKNFVSKLKIFVDASENDNKKGFDSLQEIEKFQKRVQSKHKRLKSKLIGKGNQNPGCGGSPYTNKPNKGRAKSAPPGAGGV